MDFQEIFEKNREYASKLELDPEKIKAQFVKSETRDFTTIGTVDLISGWIRIGDPLAYLCGEMYSPIMNVSVNRGSYPVEIAVIKSYYDTVRISTSRIKFKSTEAVRYEVAGPAPGTTAFEASDGDIPDFPVDAGMMCFCDAEVAHEFNEWLTKWHEANPDKNHYDDYFAELFAQSYAAEPEFQREGGDFIEWEVPETGHRLVMNATGYGDGTYVPFWGYDADGQICELTVPLIDADLVDEMNAQYVEEQGEEYAEEYVEEAVEKVTPLWDGPDDCVVTKHVAEGGEISYMRRFPLEEGETYNGWFFYGYDEDQTYWDDDSNYVLYSTNKLLEHFPKLSDILDAPDGAAFFTDENGNYVPDDEQ